MSNPLVDVAKTVEAEVERGAKVGVIFDLDSTLFCVSPRTQHILRSFGAEPEFQAKWANEALVLRSVEVLPTDWGIKSVLERQNMNAPMEFYQAVRDYWGKHFFASHFLERDDIYPQANEYVRHLQTLGAEILYLTGRNEGAMKPGTVTALRAWGFPFTDDTKLMMKPSEVLTDEGYKALVLKDLVHSYDFLWFFENEPLIIEQVRAAAPAVRIVFVSSVHSGRAAPPSDLPTIGMSYVGEWKK